MANRIGGSLVKRYRRSFTKDSRCVCCGTYKHLTVDHKIPRRFFGVRNRLNLQILCSNCNFIKSKFELSIDRGEWALATDEFKITYLLLNFKSYCTRNNHGSDRKVCGCHECLIESSLSKRAIQWSISQKKERDRAKVSSSLLDTI